jgi:hypothetical protein
LSELKCCWAGVNPKFFGSAGLTTVPGEAGGDVEGGTDGVEADGRDADGVEADGGEGAVIMASSCSEPTVRRASVS